jgi:hypothetical protein
LYPNPAHGNVTAQFISETSGTATVNLCNLLGEKIMSSQQSVTEGLNSVALSTTSVAKGVYVFEMLLNGAVVREKLVISK